MEKISLKFEYAENDLQKILDRRSTETLRDPILKKVDAITDHIME